MRADSSTVVLLDKYGQIIDLASGRQLASIPGDPNSFYQLTPDGDFLAWVDPGISRAVSTWFSGLSWPPAKLVPLSRM